MKLTRQIKQKLAIFGLMIFGLISALVSLFFAVWIFAFVAIIGVIGLAVFYIWWFFFKRKLKRNFFRKVKIIEMKH